MPIEVNTVYTKERLLEVGRYVSPFKKILWVFIAACGLLSLGGCIYLAIAGQLTDSVLFSTCFVWLLMAFEFFTYWFIPILNVKKAGNVDAVVQYVFEENQFSIAAQGPTGENKATYRYDALTRVEAGKTTLFLFFSSRQAFLMDFTQLSAEQRMLLRGTLESHLTPKKVKWKI